MLKNHNEIVSSRIPLQNSSPCNMRDAGTTILYSIGAFISILYTALFDLHTILHGKKIIFCWIVEQFSLTIALLLLVVAVLPDWVCSSNNKKN